MARLFTAINLYSYITESAYRMAVHHILGEQLLLCKLQLKLRWINR